MLLPFAGFHPRREIAQFAVIPIVREPHLGAYEQYLAVMDDHATVIYHVLVHYWPAAHGRMRMRMRLCSYSQVGGMYDMM
jgi:hypothetical protein